MIAGALATAPWMDELSMTVSQRQSIASYLGSGGDGPLPVDGAGLYGVFCATCHGDGGHGGSYFAVTGASNEMINAAIISEPWMDHLSLSSFQSQQIADYLGAGGEPPLPTSGSGLYQTFCAVCHGDGGHGGKFMAVTGAPVSMISNAIATEPWMNSLSITSSQINQIANFLVSGGSGPTPTDGNGLYQVFCSVCHGADGRGGIYKVVTGSNASFINQAYSRIGLMSGLNLSSSRTTQIANYLAAGGSGAKPTDGAGLYHVYCETCHGPNGSGGPEENVSGSSASSINSAISGESAMRHLDPYLNSTDASLISSFLR
jgi:mono/diheme cytochrome c family protein